MDSFVFPILSAIIETITPAYIGINLGGDNGGLMCGSRI